MHCCCLWFLRSTRGSQWGFVLWVPLVCSNLTALAAATLGTFSCSTCSCPLRCSWSHKQDISVGHLWVMGSFYERGEWAVPSTNLEWCWALLARGSNQPHGTTSLTLCLPLTGPLAGHATEGKSMAGHWLLHALVPVISKEFGLIKSPGPQGQTLCNGLLFPRWTAIRSAHPSIHCKSLWKQTQPERRQCCSSFLVHDSFCCPTGSLYAPSSLPPQCRVSTCTLKRTRTTLK